MDYNNDGRGDLEIARAVPNGTGKLDFKVYQTLFNYPGFQSLRFVTTIDVRPDAKPGPFGLRFSSVQFTDAVAKQVNSKNVTFKLGNPTVNAIVGQARLNTATAAPSNLVAGDVGTETIYIQNIGSAPATNVYVTDTLPANFQYAGGDGNTYANGTVTTPTFSLAPGEQTAVRISIRANPDASNGTIVSNTAEVHYGSTTITTPTTLTSIVQPTVSVAATGPSIVTAGRNFTATVTVINTSPLAVDGVYITDLLPGYMTYTGGDGNSSDGDRLVTSPTFSLLPGQRKDILISLATDPSTPDGTVLSNTPVAHAGVNVFNAPTVRTLVTNPVIYTADIVSKAGPSTDTAVSNQKNLTLYRFEARASTENGDAIDELLTSVSFRATAGTLFNGTSYTLWMDTDADNRVDTIVQRDVTPEDGFVTFNHIIGGGIVLPADTSIRFEVHADIASSATGHLQINLIDAKLETVADGKAIDPNNVTIIATPGTDYTIAKSGSLYVVKDSTPVRGGYALLGERTDPVARFLFTSIIDASDVTKIHLTAVGEGVRSVDHFELYFDAATTPFAVATIGATGTDDVPLLWHGVPATTFTARLNSQQLVVPKGTTVTVIVRARLKSDSEGGESGKFFQIVLDGGSALSEVTGAGAIHARSLTSQNNLNGNNGDPLATGEVFIGTNSVSLNQDIMFGMSMTTGSLITSVTNADPNANGTSVPVGSHRAVGQYKISTAPTNNDKDGLNKTIIDSLSFVVNTSNVAFSAGSFRLYNKANSAQWVNCTIVNMDGTAVTGDTASGSFRVVVTGLDDKPIDTRIDGGTDATFVLEAEVLDTKIDPARSSSLQVALETDKVEWTDRDITTAVTFTGLGLSDSLIKSTKYTA